MTATCWYGVLLISLCMTLNLFNFITISLANKKTGSFRLASQISASLWDSIWKFYCYFPLRFLHFNPSLEVGLKKLYWVRVLKHTLLTSKNINVYRLSELSPIHTLSICLNTVIAKSRGIGQRYISSGYRIWRETAERTLGFLLC